jgi:hypothetical protein
MSGLTEGVAERLQTRLEGAGVYQAADRKDGSEDLFSFKHKLVILQLDDKFLTNSRISCADDHCLSTVILKDRFALLVFLDVSKKYQLASVPFYFPGSNHVLFQDLPDNRYFCRYFRFQYVSDLRDVEIFPRRRVR